MKMRQTVSERMVRGRTLQEKYRNSAEISAKAWDGPEWKCGLLAFLGLVTLIGNNYIPFIGQWGLLRVFVMQLTMLFWGTACLIGSIFLLRHRLWYSTDVDGDDRFQANMDVRLKNPTTPYAALALTFLVYGSCVICIVVALSCAKADLLFSNSLLAGWAIFYVIYRIYLYKRPRWFAYTVWSGFLVCAVILACCMLPLFVIKISDVVLDVAEGPKIAIGISGQYVSNEPSEDILERPRRQALKELGYFDNLIITDEEGNEITLYVKGRGKTVQEVEEMTEPFKILYYPHSHILLSVDEEA